MAVRATMRTLIERVRGLINDPGGSNQHFSDQQIQDKLDTRREVARYGLLDPRPTVNPGGGVVWLDFYAPLGYWEEDATVYDRSFNDVTADAAEKDYLTGHWRFTTNHTPALYIVGKPYDIYGAAADLLETWTVSLSDSSFDWSEADVTEKGSQRVTQRMLLIKSYRRQQWCGSVAMQRMDTATSPRASLFPLDPYSRK
jgi:hypothetical protein